VKLNAKNQAITDAALSVPKMPTSTESNAVLAVATELDPPAAAPSAKSQRISGLDFTKGALVLLMVLYHWVNYFIGPVWGYYRYIRFLTPSFIFITGFMISNIYLSKYAVTDPRLPKRLVARGLKLLAVFLVLNAARALVGPVLGTSVLPPNPLSATNIFSIFISGNYPVVGGKLVSFSILVPISYLLLLSGALILPYRRYRYTFHFACALLLLSISTLGLTGAESYNLEFIFVGMLGVLTGFIPIASINNFVRHPYALGFAYACYTVLITVWYMPFPVIVVGVVLSLMAIYLIGISGPETGAVRSELILLGKYSLLGYISQIAILQILNAGFHRVDLGTAGLVISFFAAFLLTLLSVRIVHSARTKIVSVDRLYKLVFA
jgi:peptidoglycan/LPS O-acetylase OafA/YrhL